MAILSEFENQVVLGVKNTFGTTSSLKITNKTGSSLIIPFKIVSSLKITHKTSSRVVITFEMDSRLEITLKTPSNPKITYKTGSRVVITFKIELGHRGVLHARWSLKTHRGGC